MPNELVKQISYILYKTDEEDVKVYKKAKKLALGETIKFPSKKDDDFDEDEELD